MSVLAPHRAYAIDGVRLRVHTSDPLLEPIVHARLARLEAADDSGGTDAAGMEVTLLDVDAFTGEWDFARTDGRPVYDPPVGEERYVDAHDRLTVHLGDDHCFLAPHAGRARVVGFPDEIDVTDGTIGFFPELAFLASSERLPGAAKRQLRPEHVYATRYARECAPAAIVFPRVANAPRSTLTAMSPDEALMELTPNVLLTAPRRAQAHLDALGELVRTCPAWRLDTGRDFDALPGLLAELL